ncbi:Ger(x)C family spore germination protein [Desmospora profundinema]|uniref:Spore germination protein KC n=1 Tax=Desmospora profundinema TaxID=1571184 RepID=A0ABU1IJL6_9BACL|nr:Ger(x)C family spore germination protein [Desmospora profundinema]MDR6224975.1 spore germination protein KC [Desmospora profundinema]
MLGKRLVIIGVVAALLTGCWDQTEVDEIAIIRALGLDQTEEGLLQLSVQVVTPTPMTGEGMEGSQQGGGIREDTVRTVTGITLADAIANLQQQLPRKVFWGQTDILLLGEELARKDIRDHLDFFSREADTRLGMKPLVCKGKAREILEMKSDLETTSAAALQKEAQFSRKRNITMNNVLQSMGSEAEAAAMPLVEKVGPNTLELSGYAIFKQGRLIGTAQSDEAKGIEWLLDQALHSIVTVNGPGGKGKVSLDILKSQTEMEPRIENGRWYMRVKVGTEDDVVQNGAGLDLSNPRLTHEISQRAENVVKGEIRQALRLVQKEMQTDIFGFGEAFRRKYPREWADVRTQWDKKFAQVDVEIDAMVKVERTGLNTSQPGLPKRKVIQE